ncbi:membrane protein [Pullulanibacillus camelliae]|uniref:Membrane protein n=1 Tax=Pullulanibacillus camelliae TaxID=1707096 RepID=A0A8J2YET5_9BACL|nr:membrane protein [Pullulanibacillus camelliae]
MKEQSQRINEIIDVCLLAGDIMLKSGAETYRVEDTMTRIAAAFDDRASQCFVMPTGIIFSIDGTDPTKLIRVSERSTDLQKVADVNHVSRKISSGELSLKEAYLQLKAIEKAELTYSIWQRILSASIASGCFLIMFKGGWFDFLPACVAGGLGFAGLVYFHRLIQLKFFAEFLASLIIGVLAVGLTHFGLGHEMDKIIIGSVMPLVPGLLITNAIRDLMAGHLVSGLSKGAEAFLTAFAIGMGIAFAFAL